MLLNISVNRPYTVNSFLGRSIQLKFVKKHQQKMLGHAQKHPCTSKDNILQNKTNFP